MSIKLWIYGSIYIYIYIKLYTIIIIPSFRRQLPRLGSWLIGRGGPRRQRQKLRQIRVGVPADDGHGDTMGDSCDINGTLMEYDFLNIYIYIINYNIF